MKNHPPFSLLLPLLIIGLSLPVLTGCSKKDGATEVKDLKPAYAIPPETETEEEGLCVPLTEAMLKQMNIGLEAVRRGRVARTIELPGEVVPDPDRVLHVPSRFSGIALSVRKSLGDAVAAGDTLALIENNENLTTFPILARNPGTIIEMHLVPGEFVSPDKDLFLVADLSRIAVQIAFFGRDAQTVTAGKAVRVSDLEGRHTETGTIRYVSPVLSESTRSLTARMLLENSRGFWKPGAVVKIRMEHEEPDSALLAPLSAVQLINGSAHVFIPETPTEFMAKPVKTGRTGRLFVEILEGLNAGDTVVVSGAFELKAQLAVQGMGEAGGCSH